MVLGTSVPGRVGRRRISKSSGSFGSAALFFSHISDGLHKWGVGFIRYDTFEES